MKLNIFHIMLLAALSSVLFSGCVQDASDNKGVVCTAPYTRINGTCCLDVNGNGVCDRMETVTTEKRATTTIQALATSIPASSTTQAQVYVSSTSSTSSGQTTASTTIKQCSAAADCGAAYYGSCNCRGNNVTRTVYTPICTQGNCKYRSNTEVLICSKVLDSYGDETSSSERCVPGYMNCFTRDDYDNYFTAPRDATILENLTGEGFIAKYRSYRFRTGRVEYPAEMRCFDDMVFYIDIQRPDGTIIERGYSRNKTAEFDGYHLGLSRIKIVNGSFDPVDWIRRTD